MKRLLLVLLLLLALGAAAAVLLTRDEEPVSSQDAGQAAVESCRHAAEFEQLVAANADLDQVRRSLGDAEQSAKTAAAGDATWTALLGGLQSVRLALDADDARSARVGIDVVRAECRRVRG